ncbi:MAG: hypothetical protein ACI8PZ_003040 [Myxococcota bacterium]|jgi:hypothetical protein
MPTNAYIARVQVHDWSEDIGSHPVEHKTAIVRVVRTQRKLLAFVKQNSESIAAGSSGLPERLLGFVARLFDLAGGKLRAPSWDQVRAAQDRVTAELDALLPADGGVPERVRAVEWRAQPHVLDELLTALFDERVPLDRRFEPAEALKLFLLMWVCVEVMDSNWRPRSSFQGEPVYRYVDIAPTTSLADAPDVDA